MKHNLKIISVTLRTDLLLYLPFYLIFILIFDSEITGNGPLAGAVLVKHCVKIDCRTITMRTPATDSSAFKFYQ